MRTQLFHVIGTQPDGIQSLKLEDWYRAPSARSAAELANNYWRLNGVELNFFQVTRYAEPENGGPGRVLEREYTQWRFTDGKVVAHPPSEKS